jgi:protein-tyrosine phosphatase
MTLKHPVTLSGTPNFRDLGGLTTADNTPIRHGLLFRSEGPAYLTANDIDTLHAINFKLVCDLRSDNEREHQPNHWCQGTDIQLFNFGSAEDLRATGNQGWEALRADTSEQGAVRAMIHNYKTMPWTMAANLRILLHRIIDDHEVPVLIHCTAGKDRTGFVLAMILSALGVSKEDIFEDYLTSNRFIDDRFAGSIIETFKATFGFSPSRATLNAVLGLREEYLAASFEAVVEESGSIENYVIHNLELSADKLNTLKSIFLG